MGLSIWLIEVERNKAAKTLMKKQMAQAKPKEKAIYYHCERNKKRPKNAWDNSYQTDACPVKPNVSWLESIRNSLFEKGQNKPPILNAV